MNTGTGTRVQCSKQFDNPAEHLGECFEQFVGEVSFLSDPISMSYSFRAVPFAAGGSVTAV